MSNIAFVQNRLGRTDGVSLEVDKWRRVLEERMGHRVRYVSGNDDVPGNYVIPEIYAHHPTTWSILRNGTVAYNEDEVGNEDAFEAMLYAHADTIEQQLMRCIEGEHLDVLIPNNLCSVGYQPAAAIALHRVMRRTGIPSIIHSHDFYYEDSGEVNATCHSVASIYDRYHPPKLPNVRHVFINRIAQKELQRRKNIHGVVVPNVFDFAQEPWRQDAYNSDLRAAFAINDDDLVFLQATRILDRKGIESAIDVIAAIDQVASRRQALDGVRTASGGVFRSASSRIVLLCAGIVETIGISGDYWASLQAKAQELGVDLRHVGERVKHSRGSNDAGEKVWSLWDTYVHADFVTYPSQWEGWGNQFIEAVFARLPVLVFEYPVWVSDLGPVGFDVVSLGREVTGHDQRNLVTLAPSVIDRAADGVVTLLTDPARRQCAVDNNATLAEEHFSLPALEGHIRSLFDSLGLS
ncbi:MAG: glycosyltransferase, group 1 family protein [Planctomycetota bacterium]|nr:MAG: glycosyltransferase, group 1 family protein [Planctomycetota bacterium]